MVGTQSLQGGARDNTGRGYPSSQGTGSQGHHHGASAAGKQASTVPALRFYMSWCIQVKEVMRSAHACWLHWTSWCAGLLATTELQLFLKPFLVNADTKLCLPAGAGAGVGTGLGAAEHGRHHTPGSHDSQSGYGTGEVERRAGQASVELLVHVEVTSVGCVRRSTAFAVGLFR